jgi:glycosyltransferase involved in cell wall biosynthesis
MACGLPALVSDQVGCGPDLVGDGDTGYVFRLGDVEGLARRMAAMGREPALVRRLGAAARDRVDRYSVTAAAAGTMRLIARLARPAALVKETH